MLSSMRDLCDKVAALRAEGLGRTAIVEKAGNEGWATKQDVFGAYWLLQSDFDLEETEALERDVETTALKADVQKYKRENKALKLRPTRWTAWLRRIAAAVRHANLSRQRKSNPRATSRY